MTDQTDLDLEQRHRQQEGAEPDADETPWRSGAWPSCGWNGGDSDLRFAPFDGYRVLQTICWAAFIAVQVTSVVLQRRRLADLDGRSTQAGTGA